MVKKALVTGARGFIGKHLTRRLLQDGYEVSVVLGGASNESIFSNCNVLVSESRSNKSIVNLVKQTDFSSIFHLAAYGVRPGDRSCNKMYNTNVMLSVELAEVAAAKNAQFIFAGSSAEYAKPPSNEPIKENAALNYLNTYGASKASATLLLSAYSLSVGLPFCSLRLFNVFGDGEAKHRLFSSLVSSLMAGQRTPLSAGTQIRDFIHVDDVVEAFVQADIALRLNKLENSTYNISTGVGTSVRAFAETIADALDTDRSNLGFGELEFRPDDMPVLIGDSGAFQRATGWEPAHSIKSGVKEALRRIRLEPQL